MAGVPVVERQLAPGLDQGSDVAAGHGADGDARVRRPEGGGADAGDVGPHQARQDRCAVDVARLALVGTHAECRVALGVLGRIVALALRERDVGDRDIVQQIDEVPRSARQGSVCRHLPDGQQRLLHARRGGRDGIRAAVAETGVAGGARPRLGALAQACVQAPRSGHRSGAAHRVQRTVRQQASGRAVEAELALRLGPQMHGRAPAAGHGNQVAVEPSRRAREAPAGRIEAHHCDSEYLRAGSLGVT